MPGGFCMDGCCDGETPECLLSICVRACDMTVFVHQFDWVIKTDPGGVEVDSGTADLTDSDPDCITIAPPPDGDYTLTITTPFGFEEQTVSFTVDCAGTPGTLYVYVDLVATSEDVCGDCVECIGHYHPIPTCISVSTPIGSPTMTLLSHNDSGASWRGCLTATAWSYKECTTNTAEGFCYQWGQWSVPVIFDVSISRSAGGCLTMSASATWPLTCKWAGMLGYTVWECEGEDDGYDTGYCGSATDECNDRLIFGGPADDLVGHCNNSLALVAMSCARFMYLEHGGTPVSAACIGGAFTVLHTTRAIGTTVSLDCTSATPFNTSIDIDTDYWTGPTCTCDASLPPITETVSDPITAILGAPCTVTVTAC